MATAIVLRSESADYYTKVFADHEGYEEIYDFLRSTCETNLYLVGFDCNNDDINELEVCYMIEEAEEENGRS